MKNFLLLFALLCSIDLYSQAYNYLGTFQTDGTPNYLEPIDDVVSGDFLALIDAALPESFPVPKYNPQYISSGYDTDLSLEEEADIWVTFVAEGAGYRNVLGFYTYDINNPPTSAPGRSDITIIFPNVSKRYSGGGLLTGNKVHLGRFPAGTGIGWVLLANGYQNNQVTDGLWRVFSNPDYNPESNPVLRQHNVLLKDPQSERVILGFEDIRRDYASCDQDFNDAIFYITANPYTALKTINISEPDSGANTVSSGNDGGLESNGSLAGLIAKRNLKRLRYNNRKDLQKNQVSFTDKQVMTSVTLDGLMPPTGKFGTESASYSTPSDLIGITNATEVLSVDYYNVNQRIAAVLATVTQNGVYDHSKVICDRLNGSRLEEIRTVRVRDHQMIISKIRRADETIEYALGFSVRVAGGSRSLFSFWNIGQYPPGDYNNFQIWGGAYSQVFHIANYILDRLNEDAAVNATQAIDLIPEVYVNSGQYQNGKLRLEITNPTGQSQMNFNGNIRVHEMASAMPMNMSIPLSGAYYQSVEIETGSLFDIGFAISSGQYPTTDALYLADGPWGLDYLDNEVQIDQFDFVEDSTSEIDTTNHYVERNPMVRGQIKQTLNLFRHLKAGDQVQDVSAAEVLRFNVLNSLPLEVVLITDQDISWENRLRLHLPIHEQSTAIELLLNDFVDDQGNGIDIHNLKSVVFSMQGDYSTFQAFSLDISQMHFGKEKIDPGTEDPQLFQVQNYPNPVRELTYIQLYKPTTGVRLEVYDLSGRKVQDLSIPTEQGGLILKYNAEGLPAGLYPYSVRTNEGNSYTGKFLKI